MKKLIEKTARIIEIALIFGVVGIYFSFFFAGYCTSQNGF